MTKQKTRNTVANDLLKDTHPHHEKFVEWVVALTEKDGIERKVTRRKARAFLRENPKVRAIQIKVEEKNVVKET